MGSAPIVFLDRDGTLLEEPPDQQIDRIEKFKIRPGVISGLKLLKNYGARFVLWTNQDGLGSPSYDRASYELTQNLLLDVLKSEQIEFEDILLCPHFESDRCECRKPSIGLLTSSALAWRGVPSVVIGDRDTDLQLAKNLGVPGIKVGCFYTGANRAIELLSKVSGKRVTNETSVSIELARSSQPKCKISTGVGFFDHLLHQLFFHAQLSVRLKGKGDLWIDDHHSVEDVAIVIGESLKNLLSSLPNTQRYSYALPMDDAAAGCVIDLSGRSYTKFDAKFRRETIGDLSSEMIEHFFVTLGRTLGANIHLKARGLNDHHIAESLFKCFGRALRIQLGGTREIASTKGVLWL